MTTANDKQSGQLPGGEVDDVLKNPEPSLTAALDGSSTAGHTPVAVQSMQDDIALAQSLDIEMIEGLTGAKASARFVEKIPIGFARKHQLLGLDSDNGHLPVVIADLSAWPRLDAVARFMQCPVRPILISGHDGEEQIQTAINDAYQNRSGQAQGFIEDLDQGEVLSELEQISKREDLLDVAGRAPVIKLVNLILFEAVKLHASDVHIQPYEETLMVRMRIDGVLDDCFEVPKALQDEVISRVKVMGKMNIAEKRLPQDGRATVMVGDRMVDLRIASLPTSYGERIVFRLLDKSASLYTLEELGMEPLMMRQFKKQISVEHGIILVTGPTGSGKTTTLYAALQQINSKERNILTLEDPIEYQLGGISQTQVSEKKGMTFAAGLRSVLRQDPDIIMVGEIRDHETAVMAIQSALTGHLVFSTLHTNDAASAITRLLDLGIEPYLVASSVIGVLAQRLVRCVCPDCNIERPATTDELHELGLMDENGMVKSSADGPIRLQSGIGCENCRDTGYRGRLGLFELLLVDDAIRHQIQNHATAAQVKETAEKNGMKTLRECGNSSVISGRTTLEEVERVTMRATV